MRNGFRLFLMAALGAAACVCTARAGDGDRVTFDTLDGVTLDGTFFKSDPQAPAKDKNATVLILHNFDKKNGGSSHQDGWDDLAKQLSSEGYSVLSFDFRGFGNSHSVSKEFWDPIKGRYNREAMSHLANRNPPPDTIDHKDFDGMAGDYYPYLVNDVVAAKSFLDRQTDKGLANSSNLVLVGAGQGATVGAMWMASQWHLKRLSGIDRVTGKLTLDDPEGRDEAGALWLSLSPELGGHGMTTAASRWLVDVTADNKVPMAFLYGSKDESGGSMAKEALQLITSRVRHDNPTLQGDQLKDKVSRLAVIKPIDDTKLTGSKLLGEDKVMQGIVAGVGQLIDSRGPKEARSHALRKEDIYYWTFPNRAPLDAKTPLDDNIQLLPAHLFIQASTGG